VRMRGFEVFVEHAFVGPRAVFHVERLLVVVAVDGNGGEIDLLQR
jgi:hypothetical protein